MNKEKIYTVIIIAVLLIIAQYIQTNVLSSVLIAPSTSLFYVPAAIAILATIIAPYYSAVGILVGQTAAILLIVPNNSLGSSLTKALLMALGGITTAKLLIMFNPKFRNIDRPKANLSGLDAYDIMLACFIYAVVSNIFFRIYFLHYLDYSQSYTMLCLRIFGDFTGAFLIFIGLNIGYSAYVRLRSIF